MSGVKGSLRVSKEEAVGIDELERREREIDLKLKIKKEADKSKS